MTGNTLIEHMFSGFALKADMPMGTPPGQARRRH
jgi:hypothetical protein